MSKIAVRGCIWSVYMCVEKVSIQTGEPAVHLALEFMKISSPFLSFPSLLFSLSFSFLSPYLFLLILPLPGWPPSAHPPACLLLLTNTQLIFVSSPCLLTGACCSRRLRRPEDTHVAACQTCVCVFWITGVFIHRLCVCVGLSLRAEI